MNRFLRPLLPVLVIALLAGACRRNRGAYNKFKDAKHHPSEQIAKEHAKGSKRAGKIFLKTQKKNKKKLGY